MEICSETIKEKRHPKNTIFLGSRLEFECHPFNGDQGPQCYEPDELPLLYPSSRLGINSPILFFAHGDSKKGVVVE